MESPHPDFYRERTCNKVQGFRFQRTTETAFQILKLKESKQIKTRVVLQFHNYINILPLNFKALAYLTIFEDL